MRSDKPSKTKKPVKCPQCNTILSKYNMNSLCNACLIKRRDNKEDMYKIGTNQNRARNGSTWANYIGG